MTRSYLRVPINSKVLDILKKHWVFIVFVVLHLALININVAEWGDSYRILRAAEYIRRFTYPLDEKRPPLFSLILAIRPGFIDQILWGRILMFLVSIATFWFFKKLCRLLLDKKDVDIALLFLTLNPIYFYWSIRIMADVPFSLITIIAMYEFLKRRGQHSIKQLVLLGFISGLAILTRFEGYILTGSIGLALLLSRNGKNIKNAIIYSAATLITILPWVLYRNPLTSSYFGETSGRSYDLKMVFIYLVSLLFMFGFTSAFSYLYAGRKDIVAFLRQNLVLLLYVALELLLILLWPAAIPRLFVAVLPFLIILLVKTNKAFKVNNRVIPILLLGVFICAQYFLRLQFLVSMKVFFAVVVLIQIFAIFSKIEKYTRFALCASMFVWLLSSVFVHKDIFVSVKNGASYAAQNLVGVVGYNDISSVSDWYLNQMSQKDLSGVFFNYSKKAQLECQNLHDLGFDHLLMTNEHNTDMSLD
ncbi:MAG: glycosyltransferase family 39 protein, partial [Patescibacteria group bacterium]